MDETETLGFAKDSLSLCGFRLVDELRRGGSSWVYACVRDGKTYVVKIQRLVHKNEDEDRDIYTYTDNFYREVKYLRAIAAESPDVVPLVISTFDSFCPMTNRRIGMTVMDRWDGSLFDLMKCIKTTHRCRTYLMLEKLKHFCQRAVNILLHLQSAGYTHYDARPCNFLYRGNLCKAAEMVDIVVADFGFTRNYALERGDGSLRFSVLQPLNYDVAMFQFCARADAAALRIPYGDINFMDAGEYKLLVNEYAIKDEWHVTEFALAEWVDRELKK